MAVANLLHAEDFEVGRAFACGSHTVSDEEIKAFGRAWDPLPFHVDEVAAADGPFGGLVASGAHSIAVFVKLMSTTVVSRSAIRAGRGIRDLRMLRPVRPGMVLSASARVTRNEPVDDRLALVVIEGRMCDQDDRPVLTLVADFLIHRQPR